MQWVSEIFGAVPVFSVIDPYLEWRDLIHLVCLCRTTYNEWISKNPQRWRHLKTLRALHLILGINPNLTTDLLEIRMRVMNAYIGKRRWQINLWHSTLCCLGGCGTMTTSCNSSILQYCICSACAIEPSRFGYGVVKRALQRHHHRLVVTNYWYEGQVYTRAQLDDGQFASFLSVWEKHSFMSFYDADWKGIQLYDWHEVRRAVDGIIKWIKANRQGLPC